LTRATAAMIALMIGAHIDGVMIFRHRAAPAMPGTDDKIIAAMKEVWMREIFGDSEHPGTADRNIATAHQSPAPLIAQARRKRRSTT
jgi:hypothetical protein